MIISNRVSCQKNSSTMKGLNGAFNKKTKLNEKTYKNITGNITKPTAVTVGSLCTAYTTYSNSLRMGRRRYTVQMRLTLVGGVGINCVVSEQKGRR